jgi:CMP-2-keto-3-deoxyoctulosonic acid synthetase
MTKDSIWTVETYAVHNESMRAMEEKLQTERDRRYAEVNVEKEKALKIKETADLTALELARESQVYKDERNDAMREQNLKETGVYATRDDLAAVFSKSEKALLSFTEEIKVALRPMIEHIAADKGASTSQSRQITILFLVFATATLILNYLTK